MTNRSFIIVLTLLLAMDGFHRLLSFAAGISPPVLDAEVYWRLGTQIAEGDWFLVQDASAFRPPLYPAYLGVCQAVFGLYAMMAAVVGQHLMGVATSLLIGWCCGALTRSRPAFLAGYFLSLCGIGRVQYSNWLLSETLFTLIIALHVATMIAWNRRPDKARFIPAIGITLTLAILIRPVPQWLLIPEFLLVLLTSTSFAQDRRLLRYTKRASLYVCGAVLLLTPWVIRNQVLYGEPFVVKATGRNLWVPCFTSRGASLPLPESELTTELRRSEFRSEWTAYAVLRHEGRTEIEADNMMKRICLKAIQEHPADYAVVVMRQFFKFWLTSEEAFPWVIRCGSTRDEYFGQRVWCNPFIVAPFEKPFRFAYRYPPAWNAAASVTVFLCLLSLVFSRSNWRVGLFLVLLLVYFAAVTAIVAYPLYRYRLVLDSAMITSAVAGIWTYAPAFWNIVAGRKVTTSASSSCAKDAEEVL